MEIYAIICPKCGKQEFKYVDNKPTCQSCGYVLTDKNIEDILHQVYKESFTCYYCAEQLKKGHWKTMPDGKKICVKCFGQAGKTIKKLRRSESIWKR